MNQPQNRRKMGSPFKTLLKLLTGLALVSQMAIAETFVTIGTGGVTGVYYPAGSGICKLINKELASHDIRCAIESTGGSVYNLQQLVTGGLDLAIAQSDVLFHAYEDAHRSNSDNQNLRTLFAIYPEPFTVVARADSGIDTFDDLKGKRVNIGNPGSGQRNTMEVVMQAYGWTNSDFSLVSELKSAEQSKALCDDKIDAMVFTVGHPSRSIMEATTTCQTKIVSVTGPIIDELVKNNRYYRLTSIPGGMYDANPADISTFGVGAIFVSTTRLSTDTIYGIVQSLFENFELFNNLHPAFANLQQKHMIDDDLPAPLHEGAIKYFKDKGLM
ncbi:TAXI family TRAP transporter solute-binding subunit [Sedimenticola selenatireducens]|nr:TAXI family TRAP transporter solute-binding subunit [Sedimenticola selenatireducens]